jgi:hypothetical protein
VNAAGGKVTLGQTLKVEPLHGLFVCHALVKVSNLSREASLAFSTVMVTRSGPA